MAGQLGQMSTKPSHGFPLPKFCDHPSWQFLGEDWAPSCGLAASVSITCNGCSQVINGSGVQKGNTGKRQRGNSLALLHGVIQWQRKKQLTTQEINKSSSLSFCYLLGFCFC